VGQTDVLNLIPKSRRFVRRKIFYAISAFLVMFVQF